MTPVELSGTVLHAVRCAVDDGELSVTVPERAVVTAPGPGGCGDYATNIALQLSRSAGQSPRRVAEILRPRLIDLAGVADVVVTGPGFINIRLQATAPAALVAEILRRGPRYGHADRPTDGHADRPTDGRVDRPTDGRVDRPTDGPTDRLADGPTDGPVDGRVDRPTAGPVDRPTHCPTGQLTQLHCPHEVRALVVMDALARILRSQGARVRTSCDAPPEPEWTDILGVRVDAFGRPAVTAPAALDVTVRPVPAPADPVSLGRDAGRWALLHPAAHDRPRITGDHLVQRESNPLFRVRYAHARTRALVRNAADLGFVPEPGDMGDPGDLQDAHELVAALADHPRILTAAATHRTPDRLARHLVTVADATLPLLPAVLPLGEEKPSAAHRARLAFAEAAGTVLAGGLSLLGIDAPDHI